MNKRFTCSFLLMLGLCFISCSYDNKNKSSIDYKLLHSNALHELLSQTYPVQDRIVFVSYGYAKYGGWILPEKEVLEALRKEFPEVRAIAPFFIDDNGDLVETATGDSVIICYSEIKKVISPNKVIVNFGLFKGIQNSIEREVLLELSSDGNWIPDEKPSRTVRIQ